MADRPRRDAERNVASTTTTRGPREPWNGEFYASFGHGQGRSWEEARQHGFFSTGGGSWYSQTLRMLKEGDRIWVRIPQLGYVGVGKVTGPAQPAKAFTLDTEAGPKPALEVLNKASYHREQADDPENCEYFVKVDWLQTVPAERAFHEVGLFGNQNSICKPATPKWRQTVERLKEHFTDWEKSR